MTASPISRPIPMRNWNPSMPCRSLARCWCRSITAWSPTTSSISSTTAARRSSAFTADYLETVDCIRDAVARCRALHCAGGHAPELAATTKMMPKAAPAEFPHAGDQRRRPDDHQLHQRHHRAAQRRDDYPSQRLDQRGGHAGARAYDPGGPLPVDAADVPRQRLDLRLDRHRAWAAGMSACARWNRRHLRAD